MLSGRYAAYRHATVRRRRTAVTSSRRVFKYHTVPPAVSPNETRIGILGGRSVMWESIHRYVDNERGNKAGTFTRAQTSDPCNHHSMGLRSSWAPAGSQVSDLNARAAPEAAFWRGFDFALKFRMSRSASARVRRQGEPRFVPWWLGDRIKKGRPFRSRL